MERKSIDCSTPPPSTKDCALLPVYNYYLKQGNGDLPRMLSASVADSPTSRESRGLSYRSGGGAQLEDTPITILAHLRSSIDWTPYNCRRPFSGHDQRVW